MDPKRAALTVMAKMALSDGKLAPSERDMIRELLPFPQADTDIEALLEEARGQSLDSLITHVSKYEDRFFIALRAYMMAGIDEHFDVEEEKMFESLVDKLDIKEEDITLIKTTERAIRSGSHDEPEPRISILYERSSFASAVR